MIGTVTIVGMAFATAIAIFLVPVLFVVVERVSHRGHPRPAEAETPARPRRLSAARGGTRELMIRKTRPGAAAQAGRASGRYRCNHCEG